MKSDLLPRVGGCEVRTQQRCTGGGGEVHLRVPAQLDAELHARAAPRLGIHGGITRRRAAAGTCCKAAAARVVCATILYVCSNVAAFRSSEIWRGQTPTGTILEMACFSSISLLFVRRRLPNTKHTRRHTPAVSNLPPSSTSTMQFPGFDRERCPDRYVVRLSGALAALLGQAECAELPEDDLLGWLQAKGLITYPSPVLAPLLEEWPDVLAAEVLTRLDSTDLAMFARVGPASRAAVVASGLPRAGTGGGGPLKLNEFCGSVQRLAWAKANDCPWVSATCALVARGGHPDVLRWAREHGCDWDELTCANAAAGGHLEVLVWAREHGCPWVEVEEGAGGYHMNCCACAAAHGHLEVLKWLREQSCPWDTATCAYRCARRALGGVEVGTGGGHRGLKQRLLCVRLSRWASGGSQVASGVGLPVRRVRSPHSVGAWSC